MKTKSVQHALRACLCAVAVLLAGCSTQVSVKELDLQTVKAGDAVDGLPFRTLQRYQLDMYRRDGDQYVKVQQDQRMATLADLKHVYVLQMSGMPLSNDTVGVTLNKDNTIKKISVDIKGQNKEALDKLTSFAGEIDAGKTAKATAAETATSGGEALRLASLQAQQTADLAALELAALPADASALTRKTAENKLVLAKLTANQAARKAGQALPFADIGT